MEPWDAMLRSAEVHVRTDRAKVPPSVYTMSPLAILHANTLLFGWGDLGVWGAFLHTSLELCT